MLVLDPSRSRDAKAFHARTTLALSIAELMPVLYAQLLSDVRVIALIGSDATPDYHPYQQAVLAPSAVALEADPSLYAAWLFYTSGLSRDVTEAQRRAEVFLARLDPAAQDSSRAWLRTHLPGHEANSQ